MKSKVYFTKDISIGIYHIKTNTSHYLYNCNLFIKEIDFRNINKKSNMTKEHWEQFRQYGAITPQD